MYNYHEFRSNGSPQTLRVDVSKTTTEAKDLTTGRPYEVWVTASTSVGEGIASKRLSQTPAQRGKSIEEILILKILCYWKK